MHLHLVSIFDSVTEKNMLIPNVNRVCLCYIVIISICLYVFSSLLSFILCIYQARTTVSNIKYAAFPCSDLSYTLLSIYFINPS